MCKYIKYNTTCKQKDNKLQTQDETNKIITHSEEKKKQIKPQYNT